MDPSQKKVFKKREKNIVFERLVEPGGFNVCLYHSKRIMYIQNMTYIHIYITYIHKRQRDVHCTKWKQEAPERDAKGIQLRLEWVLCPFFPHTKCVC